MKHKKNAGRRRVALPKGNRKRASKQFYGRLLTPADLHVLARFLPRVVGRP